MSGQLTADQYFKMLRSVLAQAENDLWEAVNEECPGEHKVVQHRDRQPPWCNACGRSNKGILYKEK